MTTLEESTRLSRPSRWCALLPALVIACVSWSIALSYVAWNSWFGSGDLYPFAIWCLLSVALAYPLIRLLQLKTKKVKNSILLCIATFAGLAFGFSFTMIVTIILGPWIMAFSFPYFFCWLTGGVVGFISSTLLIRPRIWAAAVGLAILVPVSIGILGTWWLQPPNDAILYFKPGTTNEQEQFLWNKGLSISTNPRLKLLEGLKSMSAIYEDNRRGIRLSFHPGTSKEERAKIIAHAQTFPSVGEVVDATPLSKKDFEIKRGPPPF